MPAGDHAFSGGAAVDRPYLPLAIHQSQPQGDPPSSWLALAQERTAIGDAWMLTSVAFCATVEGYQLVDLTSPFDSTSPKQLTANCPAGKVPIGGGGGIFFFGPELALQSLGPTATGWRAIAQELSSVAASWVLDVKVSCAPAGVDIEHATAGTFNQVEPWDRLTLRCPSHRRAIGGGVKVLIEPGIVSESGPVVVGIESVGWNVSALRDSQAPWSHEGTVLCYWPIIFRDGFESGDTSRWSSIVP